MIKCSHTEDGSLPAIDCPRNPLPNAGNPTLTEVVCRAVYGAPFKPGTEAGSLAAAMTLLAHECRILWRDPDGPKWMCEDLKLMAQGKTWPYAPDTQTDPEHLVLARFAAAQRWLRGARRLGYAHGLSPALAEKVIHLANMSESSAIEYALAEADRIKQVEDVFNSRAVQFYELLNSAIANEAITLKAIAINPLTDTWSPIAQGSPPHQSIPLDYFELPLIHNPISNDIEFDNFSTEAKLASSIFNRTARGNDSQLVKWSDVKVPLMQARELIAKFDLESADQLQPALSQPSDTTQETSRIVPATTPVRLRPSFIKIRQAFEAEEKVTGKPFPALRPTERNKRLTDRMSAMGMKSSEIPDERTFRSYFNQGPGKSEKCG